MIGFTSLLQLFRSRLGSISKFSVFAVVGFFILCIMLVHIETHNHITSSALNHFFSLSTNDYGNDIVNASDPRANSTLGFGRAVYINVETRWDLDDAITLQSAISEIDVEKFNAIPVEELGPEAMPLTSHVSNMYEYMGLVSCYATHAKLWKEFLEGNEETMIVFEADASWDIEFRRQLAHFSTGIHKILVQLGKIDPATKITNKDPYLHSHWDLIQMGGCYESVKGVNKSIPYTDPYAQPNQVSLDNTPIENGTRLIRHNGEQMCTTSYAMSRRGAEKLLLRGALDFNTPVDGVIAELVREDLIDQYSFLPTSVVQWKYIKTLGMNVKNSEISDMAKADNELTQKQKDQAWDEAHKNMSVWGYDPVFAHLKFQKPALFNLKDVLYKQMV